MGSPPRAISALTGISQLKMVDSHLTENGGIQIMGVHWHVDGLCSEFVRKITMIIAARFPSPPTPPPKLIGALRMLENKVATTREKSRKIFLCYRVVATRMTWTLLRLRAVGLRPCDELPRDAFAQGNSRLIIHLIVNPGPDSRISRFLGARANGT